MNARLPKLSLKPMVARTAAAALVAVGIFSANPTGATGAATAIFQQACNPNNPPVVTPESVSFPTVFGEKITFRIPVTASADDLPRIRWSIINPSPAQGGPTEDQEFRETGVLRYQPFVTGRVSFTVVATDCRGNRSNTAFTIDVAPNPFRPVVRNVKYVTKRQATIPGDPDRNVTRTGLFLDAAGSNINQGSRCIILDPLTRREESFPMELLALRQEWLIRNDPSVVSTPGNRRIKDVVRKGVPVTIRVVNNLDLPSEPVQFRR